LASFSLDKRLSATICAENQALNENIDKVMIILVQI
jgi:hypothetical protein